MMLIHQPPWLLRLLATAVLSLVLGMPQAPVLADEGAATVITPGSLGVLSAVSVVVATDDEESSDTLNTQTPPVYPLI